jgi:hypothetical protein
MNTDKELGKNWDYLNVFLLEQYKQMQVEYEEYLLSLQNNLWVERRAKIFLKSILGFYATVSYSFDAWVLGKDYPAHKKESFDQIDLSHFNLADGDRILDSFELITMFNMLCYWSQSRGPFDTTNDFKDPFKALE